jgi:hypothetical protein
VPAVGRIVHYVSYGTPPRMDGSQVYPRACRAAVITEVTDADPDGVNPIVGLLVANPTGIFLDRQIPHDGGRVPRDNTPTELCTGAEHAGGTWHWPEHR